MSLEKACISLNGLRPCPLQAIKAMLHPSTSSKVLICDLGDDRLPLDLDKDAALHKDACT